MNLGTVFALVFSVLLLGLTASPAAASRGPRIPKHVDATGTQDVTKKLNRFFARVPDGSVVTFPAGARYRIEGTLVLRGRRDLTIDGNGATFFATTPGNRTRSQWRLIGGSDITLQDMTVRGANPNAGTGQAAYVASREAQHAFEIHGTHNVDIDHVTATDIYGDFVYLGMNAGNWTDGADIHDNTFTRNGRQGISITAARNVQIENNTISQVRRTDFDFEPNGVGWGADNVLIAHNTIGAGRLNFVSSHGRAGAPVNDITIDSNTLPGKTFEISIAPPAGTQRRNWTITNNTSQRPVGNPGGAAIHAVGVNGLTVTGNTIPLQAGRHMVAVNATRSCNVTVARNNLPNGNAQARTDQPRTCPPPDL